jgi:hypothetical protein
MYAIKTINLHLQHPVLLLPLDSATRHHHWRYLAPLSLDRLQVHKEGECNHHSLPTNTIVIIFVVVMVVCLLPLTLSYSGQIVTGGTTAAVSSPPPLLLLSHMPTLCVHVDL